MRRGLLAGRGVSSLQKSQSLTLDCDFVPPTWELIHSVRMTHSEMTFVCQAAAQGAPASTAKVFLRSNPQSLRWIAGLCSRPGRRAAAFGSHSLETPLMARRFALRRGCGIRGVGVDTEEDYRSSREMPCLTRAMDSSFPSSAHSSVAPPGVDALPDTATRSGQSTTEFLTSSFAASWTSAS